MIKTNDNRQFLIKKQNIFHLLGFIETFNAELFSVKCLNENSILDLNTFVSCFCNKEYKLNEKIKNIKKINIRKPKVPKSFYLKNEIRTLFLENKNVSLKELHKKYPIFSKSYISNHITKVKNELISKGYTINKMKAGVYCLK